MNDLSLAIRDFHELRHDLENKLVNEVSRFVAKYGTLSSDGKKVVLNLNPSDVREVLEISQVLVEVDRHTGDCNYEEFETKKKEKAGDYLIRLCYETNSYSESFSTLDTDYMIELYDILYGIDTGKINDIVIIDGRLTVKE